MGNKTVNIPFTLREIPPKDFLYFKRSLIKSHLNENSPFFPNLAKKKHENPPLVLAAFTGDIPVGVASSFYYPEIGRAFIQTLFVKEEFRHHHLGTILLERLQNLLKANGIKIITIDYEASSPTASHLDKILAHLGWSSPSPSSYRYIFEAKTFRPDWFMNTSTDLPEGISLFHWRDLKKDERKILEFQEKQSTFPSEVSPFIKERTIEPSNSLGLRFQGNVVGWMVTHRIAKDTIRYSAFFLDRDLRTRFPGVSVKLLIESIRRHVFAKNPVEYGSLEINIRTIQKNWSRFLMKRLAPFAKERQEILSSYLLLD